MNRIEGKENTNTKFFWNSFYKKGIDDTEKRICIYKDVLQYLQDGCFSLLDIGCGFGVGTVLIKKKNTNYDVYGADLSEYAVKHANRLFGKYACFEVLDIINDDVGYYDYITIIQTLEHLEEPYKIIDKLLLRCRHLIISVPYSNALSDDREHIITNFSIQDFCDYKIEKYDSDCNKFMRIMLKGYAKKTSKGNWI